MKRFVGAVIGAFLILLAVLAAIPYGLAAAMKSVAKIDQANCGVLTNTVTFTADQVTAAYGATPPPGDPARIAADLNAASIALGPRIIEWFDATTTITVLGTTASISDLSWAPLAALRPTGAGTDTEPEGPTLPSTTIDPAMPPAAPVTPAVTLANVLATIRPQNPAATTTPTPAQARRRVPTNSPTTRGTTSAATPTHRTHPPLSKTRTPPCTSHRSSPTSVSAESPSAGTTRPR